jgi:bacterioferritin
VTSAPFLNDLRRVRARTHAHSTEAGAARSGPRHRETVLQLLNDVLASELIWLMRYRRRYLMRAGEAVLSPERCGEEVTPADRLARRILELGGEPDLDPDKLLSRRSADYSSTGSVAERIREDLRAERIVIESYAEVIGFLGVTDPPTRAMLEENLSRERTRAAQLSQLLRELDAGRSRLSPGRHSTRDQTKVLE